MPFNYFNTLTNFFQYIIYGDITLVSNTEIVGCMSDLILFDKNRAFATIVCKSSACGFPNGLPLPF